MRLGLGWRAEIGAGILANLDRIGVLEVMAEDFVTATAAERRALCFLRAHVPLVLHATSLGLASPERVDLRRLNDIARVIEWLEPEFWSEHLAFVRAGKTEVGHLAAPPRNEATLEGLVRNVEEAQRATGSLPLLENVASLVDPPFSSYGEGEWLHAVLAATDCDLLLDLHNVHANATNFGFDALALVRGLPTHRIRAVHLAGGKRIEGERILDDHLHAVPDPVYELLALVPEHATVILERDGNYPPIGELLAELSRSAVALATASERTPTSLPMPRRPLAVANATALLDFLARLYTDVEARERFAKNAFGEARGAGFTDDEAADLASMSQEDLALAARSYDRKRLNRARSHRTA